MENKPHGREKKVGEGSSSVGKGRRGQQGQAHDQAQDHAKKSRQFMLFQLVTLLSMSPRIKIKIISD